MIIDQDIQSDSRWTLSKQQGPGINDVVPDWFGYELTDGHLDISTAGSSYAGAMVKIERQSYVPPSNMFTVVFSIFLGRDAIERAQAIESDLRITLADGRTFLFDNQVNFAFGGILQVGTGASWTTTAVKIGIPQVYKWSVRRYACSYDETAGTSTIESVSVDGGASIAVNFTQPAQMLGWGAGVVFQNQRCLNAQGGQMWDSSRVSLEWV